MIGMAFLPEIRQLRVPTVAPDHSNELARVISGAADIADCCIRCELCGQQMQKCRFTRTGLADNRQYLARIKRKGDVATRQPSVVFAEVKSISG
jgi:hypothetical protein